MHPLLLFRHPVVIVSAIEDQKNVGHLRGYNPYWYNNPSLPSPYLFVMMTAILSLSSFLLAAVAAVSPPSGQKHRFREVSGQRARAAPHKRESNRTT